MKTFCSSAYISTAVSLKNYRRLKVVTQCTDCGCANVLCRTEKVEVKIKVKSSRYRPEQAIGDPVG